VAFHDYKHEESFRSNEHNEFGMAFQHLGIVYHDVNLFGLQQINSKLPTKKINFSGFIVTLRY
jgi:hypothetical protein